MGLFSKAKRFLGGHGVAVTIPEINGRPPGERKPSPNTNIRIAVDVEAKEDATVLAHIGELYAIKRGGDGPGQEYLLQRRVTDKPNPYLDDSEYTRANVVNEWPYAISSGQSRRDTVMLNMQLDLDATVQKFGYNDMLEAIDDPELEFRVRVTADVEGSPFDPKAEASIEFVPN